MSYYRIGFSSLVVFVFAGAALAQDRKPLPHDEQNQYVVSAKAGVVNLVDGDVTVSSSDATSVSPVPLIAGLELRQGDLLSTGKSGRAEILLNPGCYLRADKETQFVFMFGEMLASERIELVRGSVVIEASALDEPMLVVTPSATFTIIKIGIYRFNVAAGGGSEVLVRKGRVLAGATVVKEGKKATIENGTPVIAALDKKAADSFDDWSKDRAKTLIAANRSLSNKGMKRSLASSFAGYNVWVYDPFCRCTTFLPYTLGFSSPYGGSYSRCNPFWYVNPWGYYGGSYRNYGGGVTLNRLRMMSTGPATFRVPGTRLPMTASKISRTAGCAAFIDAPLRTPTSNPCVVVDVRRGLYND